jgi:hypothetical protein
MGRLSLRAIVFYERRGANILFPVLESEDEREFFLAFTVL